MSIQAASPSLGWQGNLTLEFARRPHGTQLTHAHVQAPLKVQRPFYPEGLEVCHTVTLHTAGGVVGGDRLTSSITLHPQAHALITTATAAKIYRSAGSEARQTTQIHVAAGACLEWLPQETIVFNGANYRQVLRVELAENALWLGWEITRLGRSARGEQFLSGDWRSHTQIWQQGNPVWIDPQWIQGGSAMLTSPHGLAGCAVIGSFAIVGQVIPQEWVEKARSLWAESPPSTAQVGVTRLMSGLLCRYRGSSTSDARRWFTDVWSLVRPALVQRPPCNPRVWQR